VTEAMFCRHSLICIHRLKFNIQAAFMHMQKVLAIVFKIVFCLILDTKTIVFISAYVNLKCT